MDKINVITTQNVGIEYEIASVGDRILAVLVDYLIIAGYFFLLTLLLGSFTAIFKPDDTFFIIWFLAILPVMAYNLLCEVFMNGQSIGKRVRKIKVIRTDGRQPSLGNYLIRWMLRVIEVIPYGVVAIITIVLNGKGQRVGDIAAGTAVVKIRGNKNVQMPSFGIADENYVPVYPQAAHLTDQEASIISIALQPNEAENPYMIRAKLAVKLKSHLGIETALTADEFLKVLLNDFNKLNGKA